MRQNHPSDDSAQIIHEHVVRKLRIKLQILLILSIFINYNQRMTEIEKILNLTGETDKIIAIGEIEE